MKRMKEKRIAEKAPTKHGAGAVLRVFVAAALVTVLVPVVPVMAAGSEKNVAGSSETAQQLQKGWWGAPGETGAFSRVVFNDGSPDPVKLAPIYEADAIRALVAMPDAETVAANPHEKEKLARAEEAQLAALSEELDGRMNCSERIRASEEEQAKAGVLEAWARATDAQKRVVEEGLTREIAAKEGARPESVNLLDDGSLNTSEGVDAHWEIRSSGVNVEEVSTEPCWEISSFELYPEQTTVTGVAGASASQGELTLKEGTAQVRVPYSVTFSANTATFQCKLRYEMKYVSLGWAASMLVFDNVNYTVDGQSKSMESVSVQLPPEVQPLFEFGSKQTHTLSEPVQEQASVTLDLLISNEGSYDYQMEMVPLFGGSLQASIPAQMYRLEADQRSEVLRLANESILKQANDALAQVGISPLPAGATLFGDVSFGESYRSAGKSNVSVPVALSRSSQVDAAYGLMPVSFESEVAIRAARSVDWADSHLNVRGVTGEDSHEMDITPQSWADVWVRKNPVASLEGFALSFSPTDAPTELSQFAEKAALICGDGKCATSVWVRDASSCEVWRIDGIRYQMDSVAPTLLSVDVSSKGPGVKGSDYFGRDQVDVALMLDDYEGPEVFGSAAASGVAEVSATYRDSLSGKSVSAGQLKETNGAYRFSIVGDADVSPADIAIRVVDHAGNVLLARGDDAAGIDPSIARVVADAHAPRMSVEWVGPDLVNESYSPGGRSLRVTIEEELFAYTKKRLNDQVVFSVVQDGKKVAIVHPSDFRQRGQSTWEYTISFVHDAEYRVSSPVIHDVVGRSAHASGQRFVVDTVAPAVSVAFDNNAVRNGKYYARARTATISVTERNFDSASISVLPHASAGRAKNAGQPTVDSWRSEGDTHVASVSFPGDGQYELSVSGVDLAQHAMKAYRSGSFVVDTTRPKISIEGLASKAYTGGMSESSVQANDANLNAKDTKITVTKVTYNGLGDEGSPYDAASQLRRDSETASSVSFASPKRTRANDGVYTLNVRAVDLAGNESEERLTWSINRFGSTYLVMSGKEMLGTYSKAANDLHVLEINPSGIDVQNASVEVVHDLSAKTLRPGIDYQVKQQKDASWPTYRYEISRDAFAANGEYQVILHSQTSGTSQLNENADKRSKRRLEQSENRFVLANADAGISFAIDGVRPLARFVNVRTGQFENASSFDVEVEIKDNLRLKDATVSIDGQDFALSADELQESSVHHFEIQGKNAPQQLMVVARDMAGNRSEPQSCTVTVTDDALYRITHNAPLMAGALGLLLLCAALCLAAFTPRDRKR